MTLPFSTDQFFGVFAAYNQAIWPVPVVAYLLGIGAAGLVGTRAACRDRVISGILALAWVWMGAVYHLLFFSTINPAAYGFGVFFIIQGLLFFWKGGYRGVLVFRFQKDLAGLLGLLCIVYAAVLYPLFGYMAGHTYPHAPLFGVAPCPTTIFTLGLLLWAEPQVPTALLVIPLLWTLIGSTAVLVLGVTEDLGLFVAGLLGTANLAVRQRFGRQITPS
jgi:hypothetical protein